VALRIPSGVNQCHALSAKTVPRSISDSADAVPPWLSHRHFFGKLTEPILAA